MRHVRVHRYDRGMVTYDVTDFAYAMGTRAKWPMTVERAIQWAEDHLHDLAVDERAKHKKGPPRGKAYREELRRRAEEQARAAIAELETLGLLFQTDIRAHNRYAAEELKVTCSVDDLSLVWYAPTIDQDRW